MKTRLTTLTWRGSASVDPRFSAAMLPWSIADIRNHESYVTLSVGVEDGVLAAYNTDFELQFEHKLKYILGYCRVIVKQEKGKKNADFLIPKAATTRPQPITIGNDSVAEIFGPEFGLVYLLKNPHDPLLHIHFYECEKYEQLRSSNVGHVYLSYLLTGKEKSNPTRCQPTGKSSKMPIGTKSSFALRDYRVLLDVVNFSRLRRSC
uniref:Uncharacterized protein n=1 Tax=Anopheles culicifacies TaxID=139723 RepID=A0A182MQS4_9DIPT